MLHLWLRCLCQLTFLAFQPFLFDCWPFDFQRTQMLYAWLTKVKRSITPLIAHSKSLLQTSLKDLIHCWVPFLLSLSLYTLFSHYMWCFFCYFLCLFMFLTWCLSLSVFLWSILQRFICRDLFLCVVLWMLYGFTVHRVKLYLFQVIVFSCCLCLWSVFSWCLWVFVKLCFGCFVFRLPLCSSCVPIWVSTVTWYLSSINWNDEENGQKTVKLTWKWCKSHWLRTFSSTYVTKRSLFSTEFTYNLIIFMYSTLFINSQHIINWYKYLKR